MEIRGRNSPFPICLSASLGSSLDAKARLGRIKQWSQNFQLQQNNTNRSIEVGNILLFLRWWITVLLRSATMGLIKRGLIIWQISLFFVFLAMENYARSAKGFAEEPTTKSRISPILKFVRFILLNKTWKGLYLARWTSSQELLPLYLIQ